MSLQGAHGSLCEDVELLQQLVTQELAERGIAMVVATPRNTKRALTPFSTPAHKGETPKAKGKVFGRRLGELTQRAVTVPRLEADLMVPKFVASACTFIEERKGVEGIYRMSGSQGRQRVMRSHIEEQQTDFASISPPPHVLDVASLLKQFLRELPEPVIPRSLHTLLSSCYQSSRPLENLQLALLMLPPSHSATLTFLLGHLNTIAKASGDNKMGAANLAIVLSPNLLPSQEAQLKGKKAHQVDVNSVKLKQHTAILELLIQNSEVMGFLSEEIEERYQTCLSMPSYQSQSEGELLDEETSCGAARRKVTKKKHIRRRSGSLSRVLSVMGKAMGLGRTPGTSKGAELSSVHSTPLPAFGGTPAFPSPRGRDITSKRNNDGDHDLSPTKKVQRRTLETTFTPKMRKRSFSVKRFKRKKSEGKLKPMMKETLIIHAAESVQAENVSSSNSEISSRVTRASVNGTPQQQRRQEVVDGENLEPDYEEVKAQYEELVEEVARLEAEQGTTGVEAMYEQVSKAEERMGRSRERESQVARARRRSSEDHRKPRSPSQRRIGALRRRSREKEEKQAREERGRSPGPRRSLETRGVPRRSLESRDPICKQALTPLHHRPSLRAERLQRGRPNATSVGLEKPLASPSHGSGEEGKGRIKMSFKGRERPSVIKKDGPVRATQSPLGRGLNHDQCSVVSLKNDISDLIEKSFGSGQEQGLGDMEADNMEDTAVIFAMEDTNVDMVDSSLTNTLTNSEMVEMFGNISVKSGGSVVEGRTSPKGEDDLFKQSSPVTRSQLRRQSLSFQFIRPADVDQGAKEGNLRRQSSAFEFRSKEPLKYGSLNRDIASRASLRRRNSSVKDLIQRLEGSTMGNTYAGGSTLGSSVASADPPKVAGDNVFTRPDAVYENMTPRPTKKTTHTNERKMVVGENVTARAYPVPDLRLERPRPVLNPEPLLLPESETATESWIDGATFFHNLKELNAPQCGRSSIVKIRKENRGRVQDAAQKFSTSSTPARPSQDVPGRTSRRQSARLGVAGTPARLGVGGCGPPAAHRLGVPSPMRTPIGLPSGRRSTLTGIRTAARGYAAPTIASSARVSEKSPRAEVLSVVQEKVKKSPVVIVSKSRRSPPNKMPVYENIRVERNPNEIKVQPLERKVSNPSERKRGQIMERRGSNAKPTVERKVSNPKPTVERKTSNTRDLGKALPNNTKSNSRVKVKRNKSTQEKNARRQAKSERRYLTIGCPQEVTQSENRDPLRERQNLVQRSASDQTPGGQSKVLRKRLQSEDQENLVAPALVVARKHSLRSDALMSPHKVDYGPMQRVKRVHSDRSPRPMARYDVLGGDTPRRSPRLN